MKTLIITYLITGNYLLEHLNKRWPVLLGACVVAAHLAAELAGVVPAPGDQLLPGLWVEDGVQASLLGEGLDRE